jgi:hypothetical protein
MSEREYAQLKRMLGCKKYLRELPQGQPTRIYKPLKR